MKKMLMHASKKIWMLFLIISPFNIIIIIYFKGEK